MSDLALTSTESPTETGWSISPRAYTVLAVSFIGAAVCSHYSSAAAIGVVLGTAISVHFLLGAPMVRWLQRAIQAEKTVGMADSSS